MPHLSRNAARMTRKLLEKHHHKAGAATGVHRAAFANNALWLKDWDIDTSEGTIDATYLILPDSCPKCGVNGKLIRHGFEQVQYKDIHAYGQQVVIFVRVQRLMCRDCGATSTQPLPDMDTKRMMTNRLVDFIGLEGIRHPFAHVAKNIGCDPGTVAQICEAKFERWLKEHRIHVENTTVSVLGIDEKKISGEMRTVITDVGGRSLLDILPDMTLPKVERWLASFPRRDKIQVATMDMWGPYRTAVYATLPNAAVVIDKYHVFAEIKAAMIAVRKKALEQATNGFGEKPKITKHLLEMSRHKLNPAQRDRLERLLAKFPTLRAGWDHKERFRDIWDAASRGDAERMFDEWRKAVPDSVEPAFIEAAKTFQRNRREIFNYFDFNHPFTNAFTEGGSNRRLADAIRVGRGYSFPTVRAKALLWGMDEMPLAVCETCLGTFHRFDIRPTHAGPHGSKYLCESCRAGGGTNARRITQESAVPF